MYNVKCKIEVTERVDTLAFTMIKEAPNGDLTASNKIIRNYDNLTLLVENGSTLEEKYDGVIAVYKEDVEKISYGNFSLIDRDDMIVNPDTLQSRALHFVNKGGILPMGNLRLKIPKEAYEVVNGRYGFYTMGDLLKANELIREKHPNYPIFEDNATIKDLKAYYYLASEVLNH